MRTGIAVIVALAVGAVGGMVTSDMRGAKERALVMEEYVKAERLVHEAGLARETAARDAERAQRQAERLKEENVRLEERIEALASRAAVAEERESGSDFDFEEELAALLDFSAIAAEAAEGENKEQPKAGKEAKEKRAQSAKQRLENLDDYVRRASAKATEPEARERLGSIGEYSQVIRDLRAQMRGTEDEALRRELHTELRATAQDMSKVVRLQQNYDLKDMAYRFGVEEPKRQHKFARAVRRTMQAPLFQRFDVEPPKPRRKKPKPK